ncbi:MAG: hypothetical protein IJI66_14995, partial [Erysipelotrichaceae bacterium]|nr:hypothetical protein [Erysipelotrichaceae bacterium]
GGIPKYAIPDNTKCAVIRNYEKEVTLNRVYEDMQEFYGYVVLAARVLEPTDYLQKKIIFNFYRIIFNHQYFSFSF